MIVPGDGVITQKKFFSLTCFKKKEVLFRDVSREFLNMVANKAQRTELDSPGLVGTPKLRDCLWVTAASPNPLFEHGRHVGHLLAQGDTADFLESNERVQYLSVGASQNPEFPGVNKLPYYWSCEIFDRSHIIFQA